MGRLSYKNVILFGLIGLSIVLTSQLLFDRKYTVSNLIGFEDVKVEHKIENIDKFLSPQSFSVSFGGGFHTVLFSDEAGIWNNSKELIKNNIENNDTKFEEVTYSKWQQVFNGRSLLINIPNSIGGEILNSYFQLDYVDFFEDNSFNQIIIPTDEASIFYGDSVGEKYYRKKMNFDPNYIENILIYEESQKKPRYQTVETYFSLAKVLSGNEFKENITLIPISRYEGIPKIKVIRELNKNSENFENDAKNIANKAFGKNFDFVKKMEDYDGSLVYVYGYGEKALRVGADGSIEYREKVGEDYSSKNISSDELIRISLETINKYGDMPSDVYLKSISNQVFDGYDVARLEFDYRINNIKVVNHEYLGRNPIIVDVYSDKVVHFTKNIRKYVKTINTANQLEDVYLPFDILNNNFKEISSKFNQSNREKLVEFDFETYSFLLLQNIESIQECYYIVSTDGYNEVVKNAWEIKIGANIFYFDMNTGELLEDIVK